jgi:ribose 1,5-bisphosphokinase
VGRLIAVVGPSGVGKDSVIAGLQRRIPDFHLVRRVITRAPELGGEVYDSPSFMLLFKMEHSLCIGTHMDCITAFLRRYRTSSTMGLIAS